MTADQAIARLHRKPNDPDAWELIYTYMQGRLHGYVTSLVYTFDSGPIESSRDIVHDVLTKFWTRWAKIKSTIPDASAAYAYLKISCRNTLVDRYRHDQSARALFDFLSLTYDQVKPDSVIRGLLVEEIIDRVGGECQTLLRSYVADGLTLAEMADHAGALPQAFYSRWYRCLERARDVVDTKRPKGSH
jgi:DNA-directed RNA polymerase specialized sigma24 family protein